DLRRHVCGDVSTAAPGPGLDLLLDTAVPEHHDRPAELPKPSRLGRLRGLHLLHHFGSVLVSGHAPRSRYAPRSREREICQRFLRRVGLWLARRVASLEISSERL